MYKSVEYKFKKNSIYNKRIIRLFIIYVVVFVCLFIVMTDLKLPLLAIMFSPLIYSALSIIIELTVFDKINIFKKGSITNYIKTIMDTDIPLFRLAEIYLTLDNEELSTLREILKENNLYNEKIVKDLIEHYRSLISPKISKFNIIEILSITIPAIFSVYEVIDLDGNIQKLASIIIIVLSIIILYFFYNELKNTIIMLKGEENIYERLEDLLSSLYIEIINDNNFKVKKKKNK